MPPPAPPAAECVRCGDPVEPRGAPAPSSTAERDAARGVRPDPDPDFHSPEARLPGEGLQAGRRRKEGGIEKPALPGRSETELLRRQAGGERSSGAAGPEQAQPPLPGTPPGPARHRCGRLAAKSSGDRQGDPRGGGGRRLKCPPPVRSVSRAGGGSGAALPAVGVPGAGWPVPPLPPPAGEARRLARSVM